MKKTIIINENDIKEAVRKCLEMLLEAKEVKDTRHFKERINSRLYIIDNVIGGPGDVVLTNVIDSGDTRGPKRYELTNKGIIFVYGVKTGKRITVLFARKGQINTYFDNKFKTLSRGLRKKISRYCNEWQCRGYNNI